MIDSIAITSAGSIDIDLTKGMAAAVGGMRSPGRSKFRGSEVAVLALLALGGASFDGSNPLCNVSHLQQGTTTSL